MRYRHKPTGNIGVTANGGILVQGVTVPDWVVQNTQDWEQLHDFRITKVRHESGATYAVRRFPNDSSVLSNHTIVEIEVEGKLYKIGDRGNFWEYSSTRTVREITIENEVVYLRTEARKKQAHLFKHYPHLYLDDMEKPVYKDDFIWVGTKDKMKLLRAIGVFESRQPNLACFLDKEDMERFCKSENSVFNDEQGLPILVGSEVYWCHKDSPTQYYSCVVPERFPRHTAMAYFVSKEECKKFFEGVQKRYCANDVKELLKVAGETDWETLQEFVNKKFGLWVSK